jgi:hypothetical protein
MRKVFLALVAFVLPLALGVALLLSSSSLFAAETVKAQPSAQPAPVAPQVKPESSKSAESPKAVEHSKPGKPTFPEVSTPIRVGVSVYVISASKIVDAASTFDATLDVQLRWRDPRLAFDPLEMGTDRQEIGNEAAVAKLATIWTPQITFPNVGDKARIDPGLFIYADGTAVLVQRVKATFDSKLKLAAFPFDTQALSIKLASPRYSMNQVVLVQEQRDINQSGFRDDLTIGGWKPFRLDVSTSRAKSWNGDYVSEMDARMFVKREPGPHLLVIFAPFFLILLVPTTLTLYAKADVAPRLTAWSASILALIALNFTFSVRFSALDSDSLVAQVVTIGFVFQLLMVVLSATLLNPAFADKLSNKYVAPEIANVLKWAVPVGLIGLMTARALLTALS